MNAMAESDITISGIPDTEKPNHSLADLIKPRDEPVFTAAPLKLSDSDGQEVGREHGEPVRVDDHTRFTPVEAPPRRARFYAGSTVVLLIIAAIVMAMFYVRYMTAAPEPVLLPFAPALLTQGEGPWQEGTVPAGRQNATTGVSSGDGPEVSATDPAPEPADNKNTVNVSPVFETTVQTDPTGSISHDTEPEITAPDNASVFMQEAPESQPAPAMTIPAQAPVTGPFPAPATENMSPLDTKVIHIVRGKSSDSIGSRINTAYSAYLSGNYREARQAYLGVLDESPAQRDALLGIAAVAQRTGEPEQAWQAYLKLIDRYPDDPVATAGLINLMHGAQDADQVLVTRRLLRGHPRAAYLYFSLGNLEAASGHWPEAHTAFAEARRLEENNADYTYNLAVSLDHLGDSAGALRYYHAALALSIDRPADFSGSAVMARITVLSETASGQ